MARSSRGLRRSRAQQLQQQQQQQQQREERGSLDGEDESVYVHRGERLVRGVFLCAFFCFLMAWAGNGVVGFWVSDGKFSEKVRLLTLCFFFIFFIINAFTPSDR